jgi:glyoxylase-like metal-dependent hydrolase (beta-lactamase superfamily II)
MYNVGFGDCFLLTFPYAAGGDRHVLIDFGSFPKPKDAPKGFMEAIAADIAQHVQGGRLAVVATHRHADHINGFATNAQHTASGDIIAKLKPEVVSTRRRPRRPTRRRPFARRPSGSTRPWRPSKPSPPPWWTAWPRCRRSWIEASGRSSGSSARTP